MEGLGEPSPLLLLKIYSSKLQFGVQLKCKSILFDTQGRRGLKRWKSLSCSELVLPIQYWAGSMLNLQRLVGSGLQRNTLSNQYLSPTIALYVATRMSRTLSLGAVKNDHRGKQLGGAVDELDLTVLNTRRSTRLNTDGSHIHLNVALASANVSLKFEPPSTGSNCVGMFITTRRVGHYEGLNILGRTKCPTAMVDSSGWENEVHHTTTSAYRRVPCLFIYYLFIYLKHLSP